MWRKKKHGGFNFQANLADVYQNNTQVAIGGHAIKQPITQYAENVSFIDQKNEVD